MDNILSLLITLTSLARIFLGCLLILQMGANVKKVMCVLEGIDVEAMDGDARKFSKGAVKGSPFSVC